jgi:DNA-binding NarL/FixJ family response regulator
MTTDSVSEAKKDLAEHPEIRIVITNFGTGTNNPGYSLLEYVKGLHRNIPYIFYAGDVTPQHRQEAAQHGASGETNDAAELFTIVSKLLQQSAAPNPA